MAWLAYTWFKLQGEKLTGRVKNNMKHFSRHRIVASPKFKNFFSFMNFEVSSGDL